MKTVPVRFVFQFYRQTTFQRGLLAAIEAGKGNKKSLLVYLADPLCCSMRNWRKLLFEQSLTHFRQYLFATLLITLSSTLEKCRYRRVLI